MTKTMTDQQLNIIDARAEKAAPGPWWTHGSPSTVAYTKAVKHTSGNPLQVFNTHCQYLGSGSAYGEERWHPSGVAKFVGRDPAEGADHAVLDADFIAHAREDVPALVNEVRRLKNLLALSTVIHAVKKVVTRPEKQP